MKRILEIDILRGIAIILMVIYHFLFDLYYLELVEWGFYNSFIWEISPYFIGGLFLLLVGASINLSFNSLHKATNHIIIIKKYIQRGLNILIWGIAISIITYIFIGQSYVRFGILHLIGASIILMIPFLTKYWITFFASILSIIFGLYLSTQSCSSSFFIAFGCQTKSFTTIDYYPIFPWLGVVLLGLFIGKTLYKKNTPLLNSIQLKQNLITKSLIFLGKNSLFIYLIHQPILWLALSIFKSLI